MEISDTVKTCLVLHNIKAHENIVQENIFEIYDTDEWQDMLQEKKEDFLGSDIYSFDNEVLWNIYLTL